MNNKTRARKRLVGNITERANTQSRFMGVGACLLRTVRQQRASQHKAQPNALRNRTCACPTVPTSYSHFPKQ